MRPWLLAPVLAVLAVPAPAAAQVQAPDDGPKTAKPSPRAAGGTQYGIDPRPLRLAAFRLTPSKVLIGRSMKVRLRVEGGVRRAHVRVMLVPRGRSKAAATLRLGWRRTGQKVVHDWRPKGLGAGSYVARVSAVDRKGRPLERQATAAGRRAVGVRVVKPKPKPKPKPARPAPAPAAPVGSGPFPVRGPWTWGSNEARFGADRGSHIHQGQDISAPAGTPLVSPVDGTVYWRAVQKSGAGHYLVVRDAAGRDYVFMHLVAGSETVSKGDTVRAGQQIAQVGNTGRSSGAHLHFEIWPGGWYAKGSHPVDPRPQLEAWAAASR